MWQATSHQVIHELRLVKNPRVQTEHNLRGALREITDRVTHMTSCPPIALLFVLLCGCTHPVWAHGNLDEAIAATTAEIAKQPTNAELLTSRAWLLAQHQDWSASHADLDRAAVLAPGSNSVALLRGEIFAMAGDWIKARKELEALVSREPQNSAAHGSLGRVLFSVGEFRASAASFGRAAEYSAQPDVSTFVNQSQAFESAHDPAGALKALDNGIARLGKLVALVVPAVELEVAAGRFDAALARIDALLEILPRKETWLVRRAELLEKAGRPDDARISWEKARKEFSALPPTRQSTPQMTTLGARIDAALSTR